MTTNTSPLGTNPTPSTTAEKKPRVYSLQSKKKSDAITRSLQLITKALEQPEVVSRVSERGYDVQELHVGLDLQSAAQAAFDSRQKAPGSKAEAKLMRDEALDAALEEYSGYRQTVQAVRKFTASDRAALGADGKVMKDLQKFVTTATAAYQTAQKPPYTELLAKRSYTVTRLNNAIAALKTVTNYDNDFTGARADAKGNTSVRDAAVDALNAWVGEFRTNARLALKDEPVLLAKLEL